MPSREDAGASGPSLVGVGVGPGDPELLTLKAVRAIREADVIFAPTRRQGGHSMAVEIAGPYIDQARQQLEILAFPETRSGETWEPTARHILTVLAPARRGAFLTEGDPMLFGSFGRLLTALRGIRPDISVEIVPGVSSISASAAAAGVELTDYNGRLAVVPATAGLTGLADALAHADCVVILKVGAALGDVLPFLDRQGLLDHTIYVRRCGWPDQEIIHDARTLLAAPPRDYFALLIVRRR